MSEQRAYTWKPRTSFAVDVQKAGEELDRLKGHNSGELTPESVVDAAKDPKNPLHGAFEWDDAKAAQEHRLHTAGLLIRSIVVSVTAGEAKKPDALNVSVTSQKSGGTSTAKIISPEELHAKKVQRGWDELEQWHKQYGAVAEFTGVGSAVGAFLSVRSSEQKPAKKSAA